MADNGLPPGTYRHTTVIPPWCLRSYVVILKAANKGRCLTYQDVADRCGFSHSGAQHVVEFLRQHGLVTVEGARTLRPTYRLAVLEEALPR